MTDTIIIQLITTGGVIVVAWIQWGFKRKISNIASDARVTREQTENEHIEAEYPNLREEITAVRKSAERIERHLQDVDRDTKGTRHALERHIDVADLELDNMRKMIDLHCVDYTENQQG